VTTAVIESLSFLTSTEFVSECKSDFDFSIDAESVINSDNNGKDLSESDL